MRNEIREILKKSKKPIKDVDSVDLNMFYNEIKNIGLQDNSEIIKKDKISKDLNTEFIGKEIYIYNEVKSTNTLARFFARNKIANGTVIISQIQSNAKGRGGKSWKSPKGSVSLSIILNPFLELSKAPLITLATGIAVAKTLERIGIKNAKIKWPNDILINEKKVSGILTESIAKLNTIEHIIVGVGINVNIEDENLPNIHSYAPTSLKLETGKKIDENLVIRTFLEEFDSICQLFISKEYDKILDSWRKRSYTIGKEVIVKVPFGRDYEGYVVGINREGALIVEKTNSEFEKVIAGEIILKKFIS